MGKSLKQHVFNPKSMPRHLLLGQIDVESRQWSDGVLTMYSLQAAGEPLGIYACPIFMTMTVDLEDVSSWIVCDGDMDPDWVESLNSVLDDNKLLSLPSGWRIQFGPNANFLFETHDLSYVSPATISRLGIIFLSEEDLSVSNIVSKFLAQQPEDLQGVLGQYISDYFYKGNRLCTFVSFSPQNYCSHRLGDD
uniref:ATPase dynein-related AAA domain-containing protein n=1 Tax=Photinus pyralis TaxID=7054 RepID=A0A1Y1NHN1_PHOPY